MRTTKATPDLITAHRRRDVLKWGGAAALALIGWPRRSFAASRNRSLSFYAVNTGERLTAEYVQNGRYQNDALRAINRLLRDHRTDEIYPIDPVVLDILSSLRDSLTCRAPVHVVCGYRSRATNEMRRRVSRGVAEHSFHLTGQAVDLFMPECGLGDVRQAALALEAGGVGYYPASGFVHVDSGPIRTWGEGSRRRRGLRSARI